MGNTTKCKSSSCGQEVKSSSSLLNCQNPSCPVKSPDICSEYCGKNSQVDKNKIYCPTCISNENKLAANNQNAPGGGFSKKSIPVLPVAAPDDGAGFKKVVSHGVAIKKPTVTATTLPQARPKPARKAQATCFEKKGMENVGKVEDERNEPLTLFNMIEELMPPFTDLVPIDDRNGELENITTTSESLPYGGVGWE